MKNYRCVCILRSKAGFASFLSLLATKTMIIMPFCKKTLDSRSFSSPARPTCLLPYRLLYWKPNTAESKRLSLYIYSWFFLFFFIYYIYMRKLFAVLRRVRSSDSKYKYIKCAKNIRFLILAKF